VAIITDRFEETARAVAEANGLPDYSFVLIAHPIADNGDAELRDKAELAVRRLVPLLTGPPRA
jgi:hypothetical protein